MLNEYLDKLKKQLTLLKVADAEEITDYFAEIIEDRIDNGEDLECVLEKLGDPQTVAEGFMTEGIEKNDAVYDKENVELEFYDIRKIDIDTVSYSYEFLPSADDTFRISYEKDDDSSLIVSCDHGRIEIGQKCSEFSLVNVLRRWADRSKNGFSSSYHARIFLPQSYATDLEIDNVSGNLTFRNVCLGDVEIDSVSGRIEMDMTEIESVECDSVSGRIEMSDVKIKEELEIDTTSGNVAIDRILCSEIDIDTVSANVDISILGRKEDADIDISGLSSGESYEGRGNISLSVSTVSGKVRYDFLGD